jgi:atypical dual specificity phosphatase
MMTQISARIFLGSWSDAGELAFDNPQGVGAIVNVGQKFNADIGMEMVHVPMADGMMSSRQIDRALGAISKLIARHKVLVHCEAGVSRSPVVTALYMVRAEKILLAEALATLRELRPQVNPSPASLQCAYGYLALRRARRRPCTFH